MIKQHFNSLLIASLLVGSMALGACGGGSASASQKTQTTTPALTVHTVNAANVEASLQGLKQALSNANNQSDIAISGAPWTCSTTTDLQHLQSEVNLGQWSQAAYYGVAVKSDLATEKSQFASFLANYPAQKANYSSYPWGSVMAAINQLIAQLPQVTTTVQGNC